MSPATPDHLEALYQQAREATDQVKATSDAYRAATKRRGQLYLALVNSGQSLARIGQRLGLSKSRVDQILAAARRQV